MKFSLFFLSLWFIDFIASKRDLQSYFTKSDNTKVKSRSQKDKPNQGAKKIYQRLLILFSLHQISNITSETEFQLVQKKVNKQVPKSH